MISCMTCNRRPPSSICEYNDSAMRFAVYVSSVPSSKHIRNSRVSKRGLACAVPMGVPSRSRFRLVTVPRSISPPRSVTISAVKYLSKDSGE
jgi:hypothetical protein